MCQQRCLGHNLNFMFEHYKSRSHKTSSEDFKTCVFVLFRLRLEWLVSPRPRLLEENVTGQATHHTSVRNLWAALKKKIITLECWWRSLATSGNELLPLRRLEHSHRDLSPSRTRITLMQIVDLRFPNQPYETSLNLFFLTLGFCAAFMYTSLLSSETCVGRRASRWLPVSKWQCYSSVTTVLTKQKETTNLTYYPEARLPE